MAKLILRIPVVWGWGILNGRPIPSAFKDAHIDMPVTGAGDAATGAIVRSDPMSATYLRDPDNGYSSGYVYGRTDNVSVQQPSRSSRTGRRRRGHDVRLRTAAAAAVSWRSTSRPMSLRHR